MPTYEYECQDCGFRFERFQSMLDEPVRECPQCAALSAADLQSASSAKGWV